PLVPIRCGTGLGRHALSSGHFHRRTDHRADCNVRHAPGLPDDASGFRGRRRHRRFRPVAHHAPDLPPSGTTIIGVRCRSGLLVQLESVPRTAHLPALTREADGPCGTDALRGPYCRTTLGRADGSHHALRHPCSAGVLLRPAPRGRRAHSWRTEVVVTTDSRGIECRPSTPLRYTSTTGNTQRGRSVRCSKQPFAFWSPTSSTRSRSPRSCTSCPRLRS